MMRFIYFVFLLLSLFHTFALASEPELVTHDIELKLDPESSSIVVDNLIQLPEGLDTKGTVFSLSPGLTIVSSSPEVLPLEQDKTENLAYYEFASNAPNGQLVIRYEGAIQYGIADQSEQYSKGVRRSKGVLGTDGVYMHGSTGWYPRFNDEMLNFNLRVEAPRNWHVISQGSGSSDTELDASDYRIASWIGKSSYEQIYVVGGPLELFTQSAGDIEALVYLRKQDQALAQKYLDVTGQYIQMYEDLIGPYPYDKFALVENFWETGFGMPSFTLLGSKVIRLPFILHSSYPHEILHNWWGNSVFVDYETGNWCEGITAYMADHLVQEQRGNGHNYRRDTLQKYKNYVEDSSDFPLTDFRGRHSASTEAVGYGKALMFFHMLRREVGDEAFKSAMSDFYKNNQGRRASYADIQASIKSITGLDYVEFFDQWITRVGAPSLALSDVSISGEGNSVQGRIIQTQDEAPYALNVQVVVSTDIGQEQFSIDVNDQSTPFSFKTKGKPLGLVVDPSFDLFRLLDPREVPSSIGQIFGESRVLAVVPNSENRQRYINLMEGWTTNRHLIEIVTDDEIKELPSDRSVWVLGRSNRFASLITQATNSSDVVDLGDTEVALESNSVVVIRRHPDYVDLAVGFISVDPPEAFAGFARKLPHYGKYSYLAFEGNEPTNFVKGQWQTTDSPLAVELVPNGINSIKLEKREALAELPPVFSQARFMSHVDWLTHPDREGRGIGTQGIHASAQYIAMQFEQAGLRPGGDNGTWFQRFIVTDTPTGEPFETMNVVGVLPGKNNAWREQSIVLGAHYDHLGFGWPGALSEYKGQLHPGADDNASGVSVLLELAHNMGAEGGGSRNLVFVAFSAEESGLLGSKHFVQNTPYPTSEMRGMVNLDAVGRLNDGEITVFATGTADEWPHIFRGVGFVTGIKSKSISDRLGGSDQESFNKAGVPSVQLFTGAHPDYHRPSDTADRIDANGLIKVAVFTKETLSYLIEREDPMTSRLEGSSSVVTSTETPQRTGRRVSFGTVPSFEFDGTGVLVDDVVAESPAAIAGIQAGDILIKIDDSDIESLRGFSAILKTLSPDQEVRATVLRDGEEVVLSVIVRAR